MLLLRTLIEILIQLFPFCFLSFKFVCPLCHCNDLLSLEVESFMVLSFFSESALNLQDKISDLQREKHCIEEEVIKCNNSFVKSFS